MFYLEVELLGGCAKSLEDIQCRVAAIHIFRVEVALHKLSRLVFDPGLYFVSTNDKINNSLVKDDGLAHDGRFG